MIATCPNCRARYRLDPQRLRGGRGRVRCAKCGKVFPVGTAPEDASPEERPPTVVGRVLAAARRKGARLDVAVVGCGPGPQRERLVSALARARVRTLTTDDGPTCLDMARRTHASLVVVAAYLPGLTGAEVAAALRAEPELAKTRILLLAGPGAPSPPAGALGLDAVAPDGLEVSRLEQLVLELIDGASGPPPLPEDERHELERACRVAAGEIVRYHATEGSVPEMGPEFAADVEAARTWCRERWPRHAALAAEAFDEQLQRALESV